MLSDFEVVKQLPFRFRQTVASKTQKYERDGHWNEKEKLKYVIFLSFFKVLFEEALLLKRIRIYDMMADMIATRNSNQCRSHHQKMEKYRGSIQEIINSVAEKY